MMGKGQVAVAISTSLLDHLKKLFRSSLEEVVSKGRSRDGINGYTDYAIPAYIISVAVAESFINELFVSRAGRSFLKNIKTEDFWNDIEKENLWEKFKILPQEYFGFSVNRGGQPFQDIKILIDLRNDLVHYKMDFVPPDYIVLLQKRHIALDLPNSTWTGNISTSEGIRWAHNTVCQTIRAISDCDKTRSHLLLHQYAEHKFLDPISETSVKIWFQSKGILVDT